MADAARRTAGPRPGYVEECGGFSPGLAPSYHAAGEVAAALPEEVREEFYRPEAQEALAAWSEALRGRSLEAASLYVTGSPRLAEAATGRRGEDFRTALRDFGRLAARVGDIREGYCRTYVKAVLEDLGRGCTLKGTMKFYAGLFLARGRRRVASLEESARIHREALEKIEKRKCPGNVLSYLDY